MHQFRSLRRLALGAAITGAAIGAVPAVASAAASSCTYDPNGIGTVSVQDNSGALSLRLSVTGTIIAINDQEGEQQLCFGGGTFATTTNTNQIKVAGKLTTFSDVFIVDQSEGAFAPGRSAEVDGTNELETVITNSGVPGRLKVIGTTGPDVIRIAGPLGGVNFGSDNDIDVSVTGGNKTVEVEGGDGSDLITGGGNANGSPGRTNVRVQLWGDDGNDFLFGGDAFSDLLDGGRGNDGLYAADTFKTDHLFGGFGFDDASVDPADKLDSVEQRTVIEIGRLRLAPRFVESHAGKTARMTMSWKHPKAWRALRKVKLSLYRGKEAVGMINARPAAGVLSENGLVDLMAGSKLSHHGKWVTAKLAMRLPESLAGADLRVDVEATDTHGRKQLERDAGTIRVAE